MAGGAGVEDVGVTARTIYSWRKQELIDTGQEPGLLSAERAELPGARRRIRELEAELAVTRPLAVGSRP